MAAETGGARFQEIVRNAANEQPIDTSMFSSIFGQNRSDYASLISAGVPSVFFTDANGPCYHTAQDEYDVVDFYKLEQQIATSLAVTRELANTSNPPTFVGNAPLATFDDAVVFARVVNRAYVDRSRFSADDQATINRVRDAAHEARGRGPGGVQRRRHRAAARRRGRHGEPAHPRKLRRLPGALTAGGGAEPGPGAVDRARSAGGALGAPPDGAEPVPPDQGAAGADHGPVEP